MCVGMAVGEGRRTAVLKFEIGICGSIFVKTWCGLIEDAVAVGGTVGSTNNQSIKHQAAYRSKHLRGIRPSPYSSPHGAKPCNQPTGTVLHQCRYAVTRRCRSPLYVDAMVLLSATVEGRYMSPSFSRVHVNISAPLSVSVVLASVVRWCISPRSILCRFSSAILSRGDGGGGYTYCQ